MKKLLIILFIIALLAFATSSLADEIKLEPSSGLGGNCQQAAELSPLADNRKLLRQIEKRQERIKRNDVAIRMMKSAMKTQVKEIKARVSRLRQQGDSGLAAVDVENVQTTMNRVEQAKNMLKATSGDLNREVLQLRAARREGDITGVLQNMDDIISIQDKRIKALNEINKNLRTLKKTIGTG